MKFEATIFSGFTGKTGFKIINILRTCNKNPFSMRNVLAIFIFIFDTSLGTNQPFCILKTTEDFFFENRII